jgi:hypothetical protein
VGIATNEAHDALVSQKVDIELVWLVDNFRTGPLENDLLRGRFDV